MGYIGREWENRSGNNNIKSNREFGSQPVEVGKEYEVEVSEISNKGDGIARIEGLIIFVKGGQAGQKVKVKITKVGSSFAIGEPVQSQDNDNNPIKEELEQQRNNEDYTSESLGEKQSSEE